MNKSHTFRIVIARAFWKYKIGFMKFKNGEAVYKQRAAGTYLAPGRGDESTISEGDKLKLISVAELMSLNIIFLFCWIFFYLLRGLIIYQSPAVLSSRQMPFILAIWKKNWNHLFFWSNHILFQFLMLK